MVLLENRSPPYFDGIAWLKVWLREMAILSVTSTAERIGVSGATIRNWCRAGYLKPTRSKPLGFCESTISEFEATIESSEFSRLQARANKVRSTRQLAGDSTDAGNEIIRAVLGAGADISAGPERISATLYSFAVYLLEQRQQLRRVGADQLSGGQFESTPPCMQAELFRWRESLCSSVSPTAYAELTKTLKPFEASLADHQDLVGSLYQTLMSEGSRSRIGSYYTPNSIVVDSLRAFCPASTNSFSSFLDPCCGTGRYLIHAAQLLTRSPGKVVGIEADPLAAQIARFNLLLEFPDLQTTPTVFTLDTLAEFATGQPHCSTNGYLGFFDAIATNPPWGACNNRTQEFPKTTQILSGESFSLFLEKSLSLLQPGGQLSFLLPDSFLNIRRHQDARNLVLRNTRIERIEPLGRLFSSVLAPVVRLHLTNTSPPRDWSVTLGSGAREHTVPQDYFRTTPFQFISTSIDASDAALLRKLFAIPHQTLRNHADWALGIVTGDNAKYLSPLLSPGAEPILRGADLRPYQVAAPLTFIRFQPELYQQVAEEWLYRRREKLIYRFISNRLAFAYDDQRRLTLNSANLLIPRLPTHRLKVVLAFLNSKVFQYIFRLQFGTHKVLRGDLETLPFPELDPATHARIEGLASEAIACGEPLSSIDRVIFDCFELTRSDIARITSATQLS